MLLASAVKGVLALEFAQQCFVAPDEQFSPCSIFVGPGVEAVLIVTCHHDVCVTKNVCKCVACFVWRQKEVT